MFPFPPKNAFRNGASCADSNAGTAGAGKEHLHTTGPRTDPTVGARRARLDERAQRRTKASRNASGSRRDASRASAFLRGPPRRPTSAAAGAPSDEASAAGGGPRYRGADDVRWPSAVGAPGARGSPRPRSEPKLAPAFSGSEPPKTRTARRRPVEGRSAGAQLSPRVVPAPTPSAGAAPAARARRQWSRGRCGGREQREKRGVSTPRVRRARGRSALSPLSGSMRRALERSPAFDERPPSWMDTRRESPR